MPASLQDLLDSPAAVDGANGDAMALLADLQSNILSPHRKSRAHYFFVVFDPGKLASWRFLLSVLAQDGNGVAQLARDLSGKALPDRLKGAAEHWLGGDKDMLSICASRPARVISEHEMYWQPKSRAQQLPQQLPKEPVAVGSDMSVNVFLSTWGYDALKLHKPSDKAFQAGMRARADLLGDASPASWDAEYRDDTGEAIHFDALIIVAYDPDDKRAPAQASRLDALQQRISAISSELHEEQGNILTAGVGARKYSIEPFGFRDGISQPIFYARELGLRGAIASAFKPAAPLQLVLRPDPNGTSEYACGSYFVFRKLRQDIDLFYAQARQLSAISGVSVDSVLERLIGRQRSGRPLVGSNAVDWNDFDYKDDQRGNLCPFYAHVRKSNPRGDVDDSYNPNKRRIVRRALPYGPAIPRDVDGRPTDNKVELPEQTKNADIGLLFLCAQGDIAGQFEFIQARWSNDPSHPPNKPTATDVVSGQNKQGVAIQIRGGGNHGITAPQFYQSPVSLRGGEYFFAPSLSCLRQLLR